MRRVLLTGASGFVGRRVHPLLVQRGWGVRCLTRDAGKARVELPDRDWVEGDAGDATALERAFDGCEAAFYLVHEMGATGDFAAREAETAAAFARSARAAGLTRIIYLGGVLPHADSAASEHLRSRARVGEILRSGTVPVLELRASMIVGQGSLSYIIVRDLAVRLPFMILPKWLDSRTEPVAIDDVVIALVRGLDIPLSAPAAYDLPGPEILSGREILLRTAGALGLRRPLFVRVPVLTPRLSSHWVRFVTRAEWRVAREIVVGLTSDLLARDRSYWSLIDHRTLTPFDDAVRAAEEGQQLTPGGWAGVERLMKRWRGR
ncbi:MAG TPA: NAD(P)H-binding protein [Thermoanaerobaculia bacterium]